MRSWKSVFVAAALVGTAAASHAQNAPMPDPAPTMQGAQQMDSADAAPGAMAPSGSMAQGTGTMQQPGNDMAQGMGEMQQPGMSGAQPPGMVSESQQPQYYPVAQVPQMNNSSSSYGSPMMYGMSESGANSISTFIGMQKP